MDLLRQARDLTPGFARPAARALMRGSLLLTAPSRVLPDFLILGAQKAGTSSLLHYLSQHPAVRTSSIKEPHYFDHNHHKGEWWYRSFFPLDRGPREALRVGEATPYYLVHPHAPRRIHALMPEAKLIVLLREPVSRAISHYHHERRFQTETLPLREALEAEPARTAIEWSRMVDEPGYRSAAHQSFSYLHRGVYADQLARYLAHFDREQLLVLDSDDLFGDPEGATRRAFRFLALDPDVPLHDLTPRNVGGARDPLDPEVRGWLEEWFRPHNARLAELLGDQRGWWTPSAVAAR